MNNDITFNHKTGNISDALGVDKVRAEGLEKLQDAFMQKTIKEGGRVIISEEIQHMVERLNPKTEAELILIGFLCGVAKGHEEGHEHSVEDTKPSIPIHVVEDMMKEALGAKRVKIIVKKEKGTTTINVEAVKQEKSKTIISRKRNEEDEDEED